ncbi:hypothetical protein CAUPRSCDRAFT_11342 [Caulochytrium protostelioides]|nr:hypothetical protein CAUPRSCDRAFT_11342 [Caulochytrium protostelioides]
MALPSGSAILRVGAGVDHSAAIVHRGQASAWASAPASAPETWDSQPAGQLITWGSNFFGQAGRFSDSIWEDDDMVFPPKLFAEHFKPARFHQIATGAFHTIALVHHTVKPSGGAQASLNSMPTQPTLEDNAPHVVTPSLKSLWTAVRGSATAPPSKAAETGMVLQGGDAVTWGGALLGEGSLFFDSQPQHLAFFNAIGRQIVSVHAGEGITAVLARPNNTPETSDESQYEVYFWGYLSTGPEYDGAFAQMVQITRPILLQHALMDLKPRVRAGRGHLLIFNDTTVSVFGVPKAAPLDTPYAYYASARDDGPVPEIEHVYADPPTRTLHADLVDGETLLDVQTVGSDIAYLTSAGRLVIVSHGQQLSAPFASASTASSSMPPPRVERFWFGDGGLLIQATGRSGVWFWSSPRFDPAPATSTTPSIWSMIASSMAAPFTSASAEPPILLPKADSRDAAASYLKNPPRHLLVGEQIRCAAVGSRHLVLAS